MNKAQKLRAMEARLKKDEKPDPFAKLAKSLAPDERSKVKSALQKILTGQ